MRGACAALVLVLAGWAGIADARPQFTPQERDRVIALGKAGAEGNEAVLADLVKARDRWGVEYWVRGYRPGLTGAQTELPLPESLESLVIAQFADPIIGGRLVNVVRSGTYASQRLFVLLNSLTRDRLARRQPMPGFDAAAEFVVRTKLPGIEEPLLRLAERYCAFAPPEPMDPRNRGECSTLAFFLAERGHGPARTWLAAQLAAFPGRSLEFGAMLGALARFRDREALDLLIGLAEATVAVPKSKEAEARTGEILWKLQEFDNAMPIDYARLRRVLKAMPTGTVAHPILSVIDKRGDPRGVALMVDAMGIPPSFNWFPDSIPNAIGRMNSAEAWEMARDQLLELKRAGPLKPAQEQALTLAQERVRARKAGSSN